MLQVHEIFLEVSHVIWQQLQVMILGTFFNNLTHADSLEDVTNVFDLAFAVGGASAPNATIDLDNCHVEVPSHAVDEVISIETNFQSLPSDLDRADDFSITLKGPTDT